MTTPLRRTGASDPGLSGAADEPFKLQAGQEVETDRIALPAVALEDESPDAASGIADHLASALDESSSGPKRRGLRGRSREHVKTSGNRTDSRFQSGINLAGKISFFRVDRGVGGARAIRPTLRGGFLIRQYCFVDAGEWNNRLWEKKVPPLEDQHLAADFVDARDRIASFCR